MLCAGGPAYFDLSASQPDDPAIIDLMQSQADEDDEALWGHVAGEV